VKKANILGLALGVMVSAVCFLGNALSGDAHTLSVFPDILTLLIVPVFVYGSLKWSHEHDRISGDALHQFGRRVGLVATFTFAVFFAFLAAFWFRHSSVWWTPAAFVGSGLPMLVVTLGSAAWSTRRFDRRIPASAE